MATYTIVYTVESGLGERELEADSMSEATDDWVFYDETGEITAVVSKADLAMIRKGD